MKTLGILGGVGPETTSIIYESVIANIRKNGSKKYPPILIWNLPYLFELEEEMIVDGKIDRILPNLVSGTKLLEKAGADFVILPCNTLHPHIEILRKSVQITVLSIVEETVAFLKTKKIKSVGILGTKATMRHKLYDGILKKNGIRSLAPRRAEQKTINEIIVDLVHSKHKKIHEEKLEKICRSLLQRGAEKILLACTDLQLVPLNSIIPSIDTTQILINASVRELHL